MSNQEFLTVKEVASMLRISKISIWRWLKSGKLPGFKLGKEWRIPRKDLDKSLEEKIKINVNEHENTNQSIS